MNARGTLSTSVSPEKLCKAPACLLLRVCPYCTWKLDVWGKHALRGISSASSSSHLTRAEAEWHSLLAQGEEPKEDEEFAIVFAAMGVNMETAHFFKQVSLPASSASSPCSFPPPTASQPDARPSLAHRLRGPQDFEEKGSSHLPLHVSLIPGPALLTGSVGTRRTLRRTGPWTRRCCS